ncbi:MAG: oligoendopeptidase F, partial [Proteobacteria bacterium]|nr:oligoendopeptidase F [Pseudomonadota bacterium]
MQAYEAASLPVLRPYLYASLLFATDARNPAHVALLRRVQEASALAHREDLFFSLELDAVPEGVFLEALGSPALAPYHNWLRQGRALRRHRLSEAEEGVLTLKDLAGRSAFVQLYAQLTSGMRFPFAPDGDGKERDLTGSEILALLKHPDRGVRRSAYENHAAAYEREQVTLTAIWNAIILDHKQTLQLRSYADPMDPVHLGNQVTASAVTALREATRAHYN